MAIAASSVTPTNSLEDFRIEFNNLVSDVTGITATNTFDTNIIFEGATANNFETTLTVTDPTADRTVSLPNETGTVHTTGGDTTHTNIIIADDANIGSASDTNAIGISSAGVVAITATTANTSATDGALTVAGGVGIAADLSVGDDVRLISDSGVLSFGVDSDTTLTHTDGSGLTLNSTNKIMFNDASQFIHAPSNAILDIAATDEIELTATLIDVVGNLAVSGNLNLAGDLEVIGSSSTTVTASGAVVPDANDGATLGTAALAFADIFLADASTIQFGNDEEINITHVADTGLTTNGTFDVAGDITGSTLNADGDTAASDNAAIGYTAAEGIIITGQGSTNDVTIKNDADADVIEIPTGTTNVTIAGDLSVGDDLTVLGGQFDLRSNSGAVGKILFYCESSNAHAQTLQAQPHSAAAEDVLVLPTGGDSTLVSRISTDILTNKTLTSALITTNLSPTSADGAALGSATKEFSDLFLADAGTIQLGNDQDVTLTHVADTGLLLNTTMVFQFRDSAINIGSPADGDLDINADDEIELNSTLIDINGNVDISGTSTLTGNVTLGAQLIMPDVTSTKILVADGTSYQEVAVSGDVTIANTGAVTIASTAIESGMLNNNIISGQTALASGLATTDEILVSDAGTLKRVDVGVLTEITDGSATALAIALG